MKSLNRLFSDSIELWGEILRRLLELPALGVALGLVVLVTLGFVAAAFLFRGQRPALAKAWLLSLFGVGAIVFALLLEQKFVLLQHEVRQLDANTRMAGLTKTKAPHNRAGGVRLFSRDQIQRALTTRFGDVQITAEPLNAAMDYAALRIDREKAAMLFVTVVDLTHPGIEIFLTEARGPKRQTSEFARQHAATVAINGEAGVTPMPNAPLGPWKGNWIVRGEAILLEDGPLRPFLSFDRENGGHYSVASTVDVEVTPEKYNTLWGRFDLLVGGQIIRHQNQRNVIKAPRTLMGIDAGGRTLYLMVVDGRQHGYSAGLDMMEAAEVLRSFGAVDAMSCDEGGSSAMYLRDRDGLVNRPSAGFERPVYTHFGVRLQEAGGSASASGQTAPVGSSTSSRS